MFIGRKNELQFLEDAYNSDKAELIVLYGRRRIGKTELLTHFLSNKSNIYYAAREYTDTQQLQAFSDKFRSYHIPNTELITFDNWEKAFLSELFLPTDNKKILVIDEFPHICKANPSIPSILQILWDERLKHENIMIILSGSAMSFIEHEILSEKNPLYGRTTGRYKMLPMPYYDAIKFFPNLNNEDKLIAYSILGGIPYYLAQFNSNKCLKDNILQNILRKGCALYSEVEFLIKQELREPPIYNTIIETIALGNNAFNDILQKTKIDKSKLSVYLKNLIDLNIIEKEYSVLATKNEKTKSQKGSYNLTDHFFRFWYAFCYKNLTDLEANAGEIVWETEIKPQLHDFASKAFEKVCIEYLLTLSRQGLTPFRITEAGRFWGKVTKNHDGKKLTEPVEIDIVASDRSQTSFILGECKFTNSQFDFGQFINLQEKISFKGKIFYYLFSLNGFTESLLSLKDSNITFVTPEQLTSF